MKKRGGLALICLGAIYVSWSFSREGAGEGGGSVVKAGGEKNGGENGADFSSEKSEKSETLLGVVRGEVDLVLGKVDHQELRAKAKVLEKRGRYFFATAREVDVAPHSAGSWRRDGGEVEWNFSLRSEGAYSMNLGFSEFHLPPGGQLTMSDPTGESKSLTFTARDNDAHGELWTPLIGGDTVALALRVPKELASEVRLRLAKANHGFRSPSKKSEEKAIGDSSSGSCNIDVICDGEDDPTFGPMIELYRDQIRSVAAYTIGGVETCSGALINNTANDLKPYFLTAAHCEVRDANAASVVVYWNFENSFCRTPGSFGSGRNGDGPVTEFNSGSQVVAIRAESDFCLIELDDPVDASTLLYFSGWDRSGENPPSVVGIHHPAVSEKRISFEFDQTTTTDDFSDPSTSSGTHVRVSDWDFGTTEGGSSGSPLFDDKGRIIGQLEGGDAACGNDLSDWYGRISRSWADGGDASSRLSDWLDPDGTGAVAIDGTKSEEILGIRGGSLVETDRNGTTFLATVTLSIPTDETVEVRVTTEDGTAMAGSDYLALNEIVTFGPNELSKEVMITTYGDMDAEDHEVFRLVLSDAVGAQVGERAAEVAILNDDFIPPVVNSSLVVGGLISGFFEYRVTGLNTPNEFAIANGPAGMVIDSVTGVVTWRPEVEGEVTVEITASNPAGSDTETLTIMVEGNSLATALDLSAVVALSTGTSGWFGQEVTTNDGVDAAQSEDIGDGGSSEFSLVVEGPERVTFSAKVSSEEGFDALLMELNGELELALSGEVDWGDYFYNLPAGEHTLTFRYDKDGSVSEGADAAWVDQVTLASEGGAPVIVSQAEVEVDTGAFFSYVIESVDPDGEFTVSGLPSGLSFDGEATVSGILASEGTFEFRILAEAGGESDSLVVQVLAVSPIGPAVEQESLAWMREGDADWFGQTAVSFDGVDAAQAGDIGNNQFVTMSTQVQGPGSLTFRWKVSSEQGFDFLFCERNGGIVSWISGEVDWEEVSISLAEGVNTVTWSYLKDRSDSAGSDTGWVDEVTLSGYARFLSDNGIDHAASESSADDDGDGLTLLGEYAFLGDPGEFDARGILQVARSESATGLFDFEFVGLEDGGDVSYVLETSVNLRANSWVTNSAVPVVTDLGGSARYRYEGLDVSEDDRAKFYRVRAVFAD